MDQDLVDQVIETANKVVGTGAIGPNMHGNVSIRVPGEDEMYFTGGSSMRTTRATWSCASVWTVRCARARCRRPITDSCPVSARKTAARLTSRARKTTTPDTSRYRALCSWLRLLDSNQRPGG